MALPKKGGVVVVGSNGAQMFWSIFFIDPNIWENCLREGGHGSAKYFGEHFRDLVTLVSFKGVLYLGWS